MTNGAKPCWIASNALARTQPEVEKPVMPSVSMRSAVSVAARLVPKKAEAYCFVTTISSSRGTRSGWIAMLPGFQELVGHQNAVAAAMEPRSP